MPKFDPKALAKKVSKQVDPDFASPYREAGVHAIAATGRIKGVHRGFKGSTKKWKGVK